MILITGGAGYIGSHLNKFAFNLGYDTVVLDNLIHGHKEYVKWGEFVQGDIGDRDFLIKVFENYDIEAVMHFAGLISVGESVQFPDKYYKNNYDNTLNLLNVMKEFNVNKFIFSSTAAVYGNPIETPITEEHPKNPINPYGKSKLMVEEALETFSKDSDFNYVSLRYFNASGADLDGEIGENHNPETHLIPLILDVAGGRRDSISIFGDDYPTPDGTCIRDYIHVNDLASAHIKALEYLDNGESNVFNLGNGNGFSVKEVIESCENVTDKDIKSVVENRREGDPAILIAQSKKAEKTLNWKGKYTKMDEIVETAWNWHKKLYNL